MKENYHFAIFLILFFTKTVFSQTENPAFIYDHFQERNTEKSESVYLHINKQKFIKGEQLWFTAYVRGNQERKQSILWVGLYDDTGKMLLKNAFYLERGVAYGDLKLDVPEGEYFLKANTHFVKNDDFEKSYVQRVLVNRNEAFRTDSKSHKKSVSLTTKTTSNNLIAGIPNEVFYNIKNWNLASDFIRNVYVLNKKKEIVHKKQLSEQKGIGSVKFTPIRNEEYTLAVEMYGDFSIEDTLPTVIEKGVVVNINPYLTKDVIIHLKKMNFPLDQAESTNIISFASKNDLKTATVVWSDNEKVVKFKKEEIPSGLNLFSLFDSDKQLIASQVFYNDIHYKKELKPFQVYYKEHVGDSIAISLEKEYDSMQIDNASISFVALDYRDIDNDISIFNHDLRIDFSDAETLNASNFFSITNKRSIMDLNISLASVKTSDYWNKNGSIDANVTAIENKGFNIEGRALITGIHKKRELILLQKSIGTLYTTNLSSSGDFKLNNIVINKKEPINFIVKLDGKELDKTSIDFAISPTIAVDSIPEKEIKKYKVKKFESIGTFVEKQYNNGEDITLDEVVIVKKKKQELIRNTKLGAVFEPKKIDESILKKNKLLSNYIRSLGFKIGLTRNPTTFNVGGRDFLDGSPVIYLDGFRTDGPELDEMSLNSIEEIYYEHTGVEGSNGGTLYIYRRYDSLIEENKEIVTATNPDNGYHLPTSYENPILYPSFSKSLREIAAVHWNPNIQFSSANKATIIFPSYQLEGVRYVINGVSKDGESIFQEGEIYFKKEE